MKYGIGYKGSKNKLAENILNLFPKKDNFYDLFCGGGAVTHCALIQDKFKRYYMNDINPMCTQLFVDAIHGKYKNETRWISHEDFERLKNTDPYVAFCWSFGNNLKNYLYNPDVEPYKKALHYAIVFKDYSLLNELLPDNYSFLDKLETAKERRLELQKYLNKNKKSVGTPLETSIKISEILQSNNRLQDLEALENLNTLQSLNKEYRINGLQSVERLETSVTTYSNVKILPNSVVYCDIPYQNTDGYLNEFDFESFYKWALEQKELCFISSYEMPEDFECIAAFNHTCSLSIGHNDGVIEKVFIPKTQINLYKTQQPQKSLFEEYW